MKIATRHSNAYKQMLPRRLLVTLAYVLISGLIVGSFLSGSLKLLLGTQPYDVTTGLVGIQHRLFHFVSVGLATLDLLLLAADRSGEVKASAFMFLLCSLIEATQRLIGYSVVFEWWDLRDDTYAIVAVFGLIQIANLTSASRCQVGVEE